MKWSREAAISALHIAWKRFLQAGPRTVVIVVISLIAADRGLFSSLERLSWDLELAVTESAKESRVAIVTITNDDFASQFQSQKPLPAAPLVKLIEAIARGKPAVIGVVLDTRSPSYKDLSLKDVACPVVWARGAQFSKILERFWPDDALGTSKASAGTLTGLSVFAQDADKIVRKYARRRRVATGDSIASFPRAVLEAAQLGSRTAEDERERWLLTAGCPRGECRTRLTVADLNALANADGFQKDGPLRNKIVLLGSTAGLQEEYETPFGWMSGLELNAWAIDTELAGGGKIVPERSALVVLALFSGVLLALLLDQLSWRRILVVAVACLPTAVLSSLVATRSLAYVWFFLVVAVGVVVVNLFERIKDQRKDLLSTVRRTWQGLPAQEPENGKGPAGTGPVKTRSGEASVEGAPPTATHDEAGGS